MIYIKIFNVFAWGNIERILGYKTICLYYSLLVLLRRYTVWPDIRPDIKYSIQPSTKTEYPVHP